MNIKTLLPLKSIALCMGLVYSVGSLSAPTDIHNEPLAQALSGVKPNLMFILDDSGSMDWDYLPDYIDDDNCHRSATNSDPTLSSSLTNCRFGDVPYSNTDFNRQYYNPKTYYRPSPAPGGVDLPARIMNSANTSAWTAVPTDAYGKQNLDSLGATATTANLVSNYPDRAWCANIGDAIATCRTNADHTYPNGDYRYGVDASGNRLYKYGAPYYYNISTPQYCTDRHFTNCVNTADATHTVVAPVRFCTNNSFSNCQSKRSGSYTYPLFAGQLVGAAASAKATATITVGNSGSNNSVSVVSILAGSTELLSPIVTASNGTNSSTERTNTATDIRDSINAGTGTHGYTASRSNGVVTVTAPVGAAYNGIAIQAATSAGSAASTASFTVTYVGTGNSSSRAITNISVDGVSIWGSYTLTATSGNTATTATNIAARINSYSNTSPWEYTATVSGSVVTVKAPVSAGALPNGLTLSFNDGSGVTLSANGSMSGGVGGTNMPLTATSFSGGADLVIGSWSSDIHYERVDIVPTVGALPKTFPRGTNRDDCITSATYCTYDEEMTNFANWFAYYRTRLQSAKSASGRAFSGISDSMRVGFITINPNNSSGNLSSSRYLRIGEFAYDSLADSGHKKDWYTKLYNITTNGNTPLREALSRVGRLYGGKTTGINSGFSSDDDPMQYSCQPNFSILTTDGYWNSSAGITLADSSNSIGDQDNADSGWSKRVDGAYDGNLGATNTLADVAMYYYKTDLRTGASWPNNVFSTSKDTAQHQHMTTFTVSLGLSGQLDYDKDYETETSGDFYAIKQGSLNWPIPVSGGETALDDLWHAAVNGRGSFYSAASPEDFNNGLTDALTQMFTRGGAGSAAATSNLQPVQADNFAFTAEYATTVWTGDLIARTINTSTGVVASHPLWSAAEKLNDNNYVDRVIFTFDATDSTGNFLKHFCWPSGGGICSDGNGLTSTEQDYFNPNQLGQYSGWSTIQKSGASGSTLVDYLKGDRANETTGGSSGNDLYRSRASVLGDIINAQPSYVKGSPYNYDAASNPYYQAYKTSVATRRGTVYAAANDGMLHAFETDVNSNPYYQTAGIDTVVETDDTFTGNNSGNGEERWAYIPGILLPKLYKLAETPYTHRYYVDGSPVIGDVCSGHTASTPCTGTANWKTILVGGFSSGGRGFYALDVTDPLVPKALWEFSSTGACLDDVQANSGTYSNDCNVGLSYGNPLIVKRPSDDRWVVIVTSGYNNFNPGDGKGYLYILDAITGKILQRISTGVGSGGTAGASGGPYSDADPSGLGKINGWATNAIENNKVLAVYGGDLKGNLWRFDLDPGPSAAPNPYVNTAFRLTTLKDSLDNVQPITVKPELGEVTPYRIILLGTGRYLGTDDPDDLSKQTIYGIRDDLSQTSVVVRTNLVARTFNTYTATATVRNTASGASLDWINNKGWYIDLPDLGERVNVDPQLQLGTLIIGSNIPSTDICTAGGYSWLNYFDYKQGTQLTGTNASGKVGSALIVGLSTIKTGSTVRTIVTTADNQRSTQAPPVSTSAFADRRVSWREIINE